eukprot:537193_1
MTGNIDFNDLRKYSSRHGKLTKQMEMISTLILLLVINSLFADPLPFDGLIRQSSDGSYIAYLNQTYSPRDNHASFLEQFPSYAPYELGLAWFSGDQEDPRVIVYSRLPKGSQQWTNPIVISMHHNYTNQNPVLFFDSSSNILHCFHSHGPANAGTSAAHIYHLQSNDYGSNWTQPKPLFTFAGAFTRNRIIPATTTKGVLFPIYEKGSSSSIIAKSSNMDLGNNKSYTLYPIANSSHLVQPSIIRLPGSSNGKLKAFFRDRRAIAIYEATSIDDGENWEIPYPFQLPNNNAAIQANVIANGGPIVLLFNNYNGNNQLGRTPLAIGLSYDDGTTWSNIRLLQIHNDNETAIPIGSGREFAYPSVLQTSDGFIHSTYTYNQQTIKYLKYNLTWALIG